MPAMWDAKVTDSMELNGQRKSQDEGVVRGTSLMPDDVLMNPLVELTGHQGNPHNVLFEIKVDDDKVNESQFSDAEYASMNFGEVFAIDNKCFCVKQTDKVKIESLRIYLMRMERFITEVFRDLKTIMDGEFPITDFQYPSLRKVVDFITYHTMYELKGRQCLKILEGLVIGFYNIMNIGFDAAVDSKEHVANIIQKDWKGIWQHGVDELDLDFFKLTMGTVSKVISEKYMSEVTWVIKSNLFTHIVDKHVVECTEATRLK